MSRQRLILLIVLVVIVVAIGYLQSRKVGMSRSAAGDSTITSLDTSARVKEKEKKYERAKEVSTPDGFINTDLITLQSLIGKKVILIDFWTYSCINCQRTIPYLENWYQKYSDDGFEILAVHTPEFEFEKDFENVRRAVEKFGITYPVILDNDYSTWTAYKNQYWPRKYLIDIDGFIVYDHIGEGAYGETEEKIVELLNERSRILGEREVAQDTTEPKNIDAVDFGKVQTPETYLGYARLQYIANLPSTNCFDTLCTFTLPSEVQRNTFVLGGDWTLKSEQAALSTGDGSLGIGFFANKVNLVAGASTPVVAEIYLDGKRIDETYAGADVKDGKVTIGAHDLYNLVDLRGEAGEHLLLIHFLSPQVEVYAFTFG
jgi:thiol-disulfide isomerase/thioredoxin